MISVMSCALFFLASGCAQLESSPRYSQNSEDQFLKHIVAADGETLSAIALWYTGEVKNWRSVYVKAQSGKLTQLRSGDSVLIPRSLVIRPGPVPFRLFRRTQAKSTSRRASRSNAGLGKGASAPQVDASVEEEAAAEERDAREAQNEFLQGLVQSPSNQ